MESLLEQIERLRLALASSFCNSMRDFCWAVRSEEEESSWDGGGTGETESECVALMESVFKRLAEEAVGWKRSSRVLFLFLEPISSFLGCSFSNAIGFTLIRS